MLISRDILDARAFCEDKQTDPEQICWRDSSLLKWLNDTFLNTAFTEEEQEAIVPKENGIGRWWGAGDGDEVLQKVNLADEYDVELIQEDYPELVSDMLPARVTPYAYARGAYRDEETGNGIWRLVTFGGCRPELEDRDIWSENHLGFVCRMNQTVNPDGTLDLYGDSVYADYVGIRPVIVVQLSKLAVVQDEQ